MPYQAKNTSGIGEMSGAGAVGYPVSSSPKHLRIEEAVGNVTDAITGVEDLLGVVQGGMPAANETSNHKPTMQPNLMQVLNETPQVLNEQAARLRKLTETLRSALLD